MKSLGGSNRILVVEDVATNRALLRGILNSQGFEVLECDNGEQCLQSCGRELPRMILLDIVMPGIDGIETCRRLRQCFSSEELPVIMVTNRSEREALEEALKAGANDYVTKPIDRVALLARIDKQLAVSAFQREIRTQKQALERSLAIQCATGDVLPEAMLVLGPDGSPLYSNVKLAQLCAGKSPSGVKEAFERVFGGLLLQFWQGWSARIEREPDLFIDQELELGHVDYSDVRVLSRSFAVSDFERLRLWVWWDLSSVRQLERKLNQRMKLETVAAFAQGVAHNFNNLFASVLGAAELLARGVVDERSQRCIDIIKRAIESGSALNDKLSSLGRSDQPLHQSGPVDFEKLISRLLKDEQIAVAGRVDFRFDLPSPCPQIMVPEGSLTVIVRNVLRNAVEAIPQRGRVELRLEVQAAGLRAALYITDNGVGMDAQAMGKLFQPFFSTKNLDRPDGVSLQANGLGLWNVYNLLKIYGGDINISSRPGQGTQVTLLFPVSTLEN
jgi:signal transduction histidine kinase/CheY-like chemotaxis protein